MQKSEAGTTVTFVLAWTAQNWTDYLEPMFQALLIILTVVAAFYMAWNRVLDNCMKRKQLRDYEWGKAGGD
ncbi:hypothetical protein [Pseudovibrio sp. Tun.PSC04-5.I4]|uniref:hypothetical protein n=1 Tax=Pseudovibrio sp. Tun.PSC04-5.I4 TaxID=1798213 RepID=UPI000885C5D0|nr:hypothetical protein [Pseudovibrio sp. Tun.PSC04-5.I4]SDR01462.1 hypothetical protein SAMN04515695_2320 [Pseudovibrio sp. Tun.PSC04-5.I4]